MGIKIISEDTNVETGYKRALYKNKNYEIMLSEMDQKKMLPEHNHRHIQFGYCFKGGFILNVEDIPLRIGHGNSYVLNTDIRHSVMVEQEIYSLDIKLDAAINMREAFQLNVLNVYKHNDFDILCYIMGYIRVYRIYGVGRITKKGLNSRNEWIILSAGSSTIISESSTHHLQPMKIYEADMQEMEIGCNDEGMIIICL